MYYSPSFRQCLIHVPTSYASRWPENLGSGGPGGSSRRPGQSLDHVPEVAGPQRLPGGLHVREVVGEGLPKLEVELEPERKRPKETVVLRTEVSPGPGSYFLSLLLAFGPLALS